MLKILCGHATASETWSELDKAAYDVGRSRQNISSFRWCDTLTQASPIQLKEKKSRSGRRNGCELCLHRNEKNEKKELRILCSITINGFNKRVHLDS